MKCSDICRGTFAAIELILRDVALEKTDIDFETVVSMLESQVEMLRQTWDVEKNDKPTS